MWRFYTVIYWRGYFIVDRHHYLCSNRSLFPASVHVGRFIYTLHRNGPKLRKTLFSAWRLVSRVLYKIAFPNIPLMLSMCGWGSHVFPTRAVECCAAFAETKKRLEHDRSMIELKCWSGCFKIVCCWHLPAELIICSLDCCLVLTPTCFHSLGKS